MGVSCAFLKSDPLERDIYAARPLFAGGNTDTRRGLLNPLHGLSTAGIERYGTLKSFLRGWWK